eukprot:3547368-Rhodomonas_salina.1
MGQYQGSEARYPTRANAAVGQCVFQEQGVPVSVGVILVLERRTARQSHDLRSEPKSFSSSRMCSAGIRSSA